MSESWGPLGPPPKWVLTGSRETVKKYRDFVTEANKILKMAGRQRAVKMAELKAKFHRDFPEGSNEHE